MSSKSRWGCDVMDAPLEQLANVVVSFVVAGAAAYLVTYLRTRGQQRALEETAERLKRIEAEVAESSKMRWAKQPDVFTSVYSTVQCAFGNVRQLGRCTIEDADEMVTHAASAVAQLGKSLDEVGLYLPESLYEQVQWILTALRDVSTRHIEMNEAWRSAGKSVAETTNAQRALRKEREASAARFCDDGDICKAVAKLHARMRKHLRIDDMDDRQ